MIVRQRIVSFGIPALAIGAVITAALLHRREAPRLVEAQTDVTNSIPSFAAKPASGKHQIDVVFAVDTTGSMRELIDGAKRTVWSIATHIRNSDPDADLRIGMVAYRDINEVYVTKPFALTTDLDAVFTELSSYTASGGGDTPEDLDAALYDALHMQWRQSAKKLVFVVGDAPPATRGEVPAFDVSAKEAAGQGIIINTIRCGTAGDTAVAFQRIASLAGGEFSSIAQDGGVHQIATPYDDKLAELSATVDRTAVIIGDEGVHRGYADKMKAADAAPAAAKADRATYYAKSAKPAKGGGWSGRTREDLVAGVATGSMTVEGVKTEELPSDMRGLNKDQLKVEVEKRAKERTEAQKAIADLSKKREEYITAHAKDGEGGFDAKVKATLEKQLK